MENNKMRMLEGKLYNPEAKELKELRTKAHNLFKIYNNLKDEDIKKRKKILDELIPNKGNNVYMEGPIYIDYGCNIRIGNNFYANFNLTILDTCPVNIGDNVFIGPNVSIYTPLHPLIGEERRIYLHSNGEFHDDEYGKPINIGNDVWIAGNVTILPGVNIGDNVVIGAGSVVHDSLPKGYLCAGNPCKPIRKILKKDSIHNIKEIL